MRLVEITCPNCNAQLMTEDSRQFLFCEYCGTKVYIEATDTFNEYEQPIANRRMIKTLEILKNVLPEKEAKENRLNEVQQELEKTEKVLKRLQYAEFNKAHRTALVISIALCAIFAVSMLAFAEPLFFFLAWLSAGGIAFFYIRYSQVKTRDLQVVRYEKLQEEETSLLEELEEMDKLIGEADKELLPPDYRDSDSLSFIYDALINQRATTIKEAVNLYEQDKQNKKIEDLERQQLQNLETIKAQQQTIQRMASQGNFKRRR